MPLQKKTIARQTIHKNFVFQHNPELGKGEKSLEKLTTVSLNTEILTLNM